MQSLMLSILMWKSSLSSRRIFRTILHTTVIRYLDMIRTLFKHVVPLDDAAENSVPELRVGNCQTHCRVAFIQEASWALWIKCDCLDEMEPACRTSRLCACETFRFVCGSRNDA